MIDIFVRKFKKRLNVGDGELNPDIDTFAAYGESGNGEFNGRSNEFLDRVDYNKRWENTFGKPAVNKANGNSNPQKEEL